MSLVHCRHPLIWALAEAPGGRPIRIHVRGDPIGAPAGRAIRCRENPVRELARPISIGGGAACVAVGCAEPPLRGLGSTPGPGPFAAGLDGDPTSSPASPYLQAAAASCAANPLRPVSTKSDDVIMSSRPPRAVFADFSPSFRPVRRSACRARRAAGRLGRSSTKRRFSPGHRAGRMPPPGPAGGEPGKLHLPDVPMDLATNTECGWAAWAVFRAVFARRGIRPPFRPSMPRVCEDYPRVAEEARAQRLGIMGHGLRPDSDAHAVDQAPRPSIAASEIFLERFLRSRPLGRGSGRD